MTIGQALTNPKVLALAAAYYFVVTGSYGIEMYMASIFKDWYHRDVRELSYLVVIPALGALTGQLLIGWNSDRTHERRWHASLPIVVGAAQLFRYMTKMYLISSVHNPSGTDAQIVYFRCALKTARQSRFASLPRGR